MDKTIGLICLITMIIPIFGLYYTIRNRTEYSKAEYIFRICTITFGFFLLLGFAVKFKISSETVTNATAIINGTEYELVPKE